MKAPPVDHTTIQSSPHVNAGATSIIARSFILFCLIWIYSLPSLAMNPEYDRGRVTLTDTFVSPVFTTINFSQSFTQPPLVFSLATNEGGDPSALRVRNVTTTGFEMTMVESPGEDGPHIAMTVDWIAIEPGDHTLPDGSRMLASSIDTTRFQSKFGGASWETVNFAPAFSATPVVLAMIQTMNNESSTPPQNPSVPWLVTAMRNVTANSMQLALERAETTTGTITLDETIAYLVIEAGITGLLPDGHRFETIRSADSIRGWGTCSDSLFQLSYTSTPFVVATQNTRDGGDGGWLRRCNFQVDRIGLLVDEDMANDSERNHTTERAGILAIDPQPFITPLADLRMDQGSWTGAPGEVIDSGPNANHADTVGGINPQTGFICNAASIPLNTTGTAYQAVDTGLDMDSDIGSSGTISFWYNSNTAWDDGNERRLFDATDGVKYFFASIDGSGRIRYWFEDGSDGDYQATTTTAFTGFANTWKHLAFTWDVATTSARVFVDGVEQSLNFANTGNTTPFSGFNTLYLGDNRHPTYIYSGTSANGLIDEALILDQALSASEILFIYNQNLAGSSWDGVTRVCPVFGPDYFVTAHDGSGIYCLAEPVSVTATNTGGATATSYTGTITLDTQTGDGNWSLVSGSGSFNDVTADDGLATYTYALADAGVAIFELDYPQGTDIFDIEAFDGGIADDDSEGDITFAASGFTVTATALANPPPNPINDPIPTQIAGTDFDVHITAYGTTPTDPQCGVIESYSGIKTLSQSTTWIDPAPAVLSATGGGNINFTNGQAVVTAKYKDSGSIRLDYSEGSLNGNSNVFVVQPASFEIVLSGSNQTALDHTGTAYTSAGTDFSVTVTAKDSEGDTTASYGNETSAESISLSHSLVLPGGGVSGTLSGGLGLSGPAEFSGTFNYSEVGIIDLTASVGDGDFLGTGNITSTFSNVGRFTPASFEVNVTNSGWLENTCQTGLNPFTYIGQDFGYLVNPTFDVTAKSALAPTTTTQNYRGNFVKLDATSVTVSGVTTDSSNLGNDGLTLMNIFFTSASMTTTPDNNGTVAYAFGNDRYRYGPDPTLLAYSKDSNSEVTPFMADIDRSITLVDDGDVASIVNETVSPTGNEQRFGRIELGNAHGSELLDLQMPMIIEYLSASGYIQNTDDHNCTLITDANLSITDNLSTPGSSTVSVINTPSNLGDLGVNLTSPGAGINGNIVVSPDLDADNVKWLRYDWNASGQFDNDPTATGTFGIFDGDPVQIYLQQIYQ
ncbi:MAG: DUF6701 domain-containing protein [Pseudomonadota bacterium]